ncbi:MAG TPA: SAM-dependent methyltransferase [Candidatus Scybalocola faecipullorum]|nr:SAM-dependent methyltransferase [Candidatus Scybalocola faecipullorum]
MNLSKRLTAVAAMVSPGNRLADIGTDHGYVPIYLVEKGIVPSAIAMDVRRGPLEKAAHNIKVHGLEQLIQTRLSDGLKQLRENEADTVLIAGMGGALMSRILNDGAGVLSGIRELILQPQSEICDFRHFLHDHGYTIADEQMLIDDGKYYVLFKAVHGTQRYDTETEYMYGSLLLHRQDPVLHAFILKEIRTYETILNQLICSDSERTLPRRRQLSEKLAYGKEALTYYEMQ